MKPLSGSTHSMNCREKRVLCPIRLIKLSSQRAWPIYSTIYRVNGGGVGEGMWSEMVQNICNISNNLIMYFSSYPLLFSPHSPNFLWKYPPLYIYYYCISIVPLLQSSSQTPPPKPSPFFEIHGKWNYKLYIYHRLRIFWCWCMFLHTHPHMYNAFRPCRGGRGVDYFLFHIYMMLCNYHTMPTYMIHTWREIFL